MPLTKNDLLNSLAPEWPADVLPEIQRALAKSGQKVVVFDDDPTGTQTIHGIPVLTEWSVESLRAELEREQPAFYVLTNTRAMSLAMAQHINAEIAKNLLAATPKDSDNDSGSEFAILSRSDSTLRGHFPGETDALATALGVHLPTLIVPAFFAGGRYTINDVHYVATGDELVPAGDTEFARDATFGYRASNLREWVEEKSFGRIKSSDVVSISIDDIRMGGPTHVAQLLMRLSPTRVCIVNAAAERDLEVVALASIMSESSGHPLLYRTAASFARARVGITQRPLLTQQDLRIDEETRNGGLIVVGSYVPKTSGQLNVLLQTNIDAIEVNVEAVLNDTTQSTEIARVANEAEIRIANSRDVVIYTSRKLITGHDATSSLAIGNRVSDSLIRMVQGIATQPQFVIAKGGITSSDIATKALNVRRAMVLGQLLPGVPVWRLGPESLYPDSIYIVFPGNVGGANALVEAWQKVRSASRYQ